MRWALTPESNQNYWVQISGLLAELVLGGTLGVISHKGSNWFHRYSGFGALVLLVHAPAYACICLYYGYSDGENLASYFHSANRAWAWGCVVPVMLWTIYLARNFTGTVLGGLSGSSSMALLTLIPAIVGTVIVHGTLTLSEDHFSSDATKAQIFTPDYVHSAVQELVQLDQSHPDQYTQQNHEQQLIKIIDEHRTFPYELVLGPCLILGLVMGSLRAQLDTKMSALEESLRPALFFGMISLVSVGLLKIIF